MLKEKTTKFTIDFEEYFKIFIERGSRLALKKWNKAEVITSDKLPIGESSTSSYKYDFIKNQRKVFSRLEFKRGRGRKQLHLWRSFKINE